MSSDRRARLLVSILMWLCPAILRGADTDTGVVSCDYEDPTMVHCSGHWLRVQDLAETLAPELWFSPDEPATGQIPEGMLCDSNAPKDCRVVYYRLTSFVRPHVPDIAQPALAEVMTVPGTIDLSKVRLLALRYYFYYSQDEGFEAHQHDIESVDVILHVQHGEDVSGRLAVRIVKVIGAAHGSAFQANHLRLWGLSPGNELESPAKPRHTTTAGAVVPSFQQPITLFVEEGKHASCPDRNGDGMYTPGFDVNEAVNDAWGLRDVFGAGVLGEAKHSPAMAKLRGSAGKPGKRIRLAPKERRYSDSCRGNPDEYILLPAVRSCKVTHKGANTKWLHDKMDELIGTDDAPREALDEYDLEGLGTLRFLSLHGRYASGWTAGASVVLGHLPVVPGWVQLSVSAARLDDRFLPIAELSYSPSISRWSDWYALVGAEFGEPRRWALEGGLQLRFRALGIRVGLRHRGGLFDEAPPTTGAAITLSIGPKP